MLAGPRPATCCDMPVIGCAGSEYGIGKKRKKILEADFFPESAHFVFPPSMADECIVQMKAVFSYSDAVLRQRLIAYGNDVERAMESLCDDPPSDIGADVPKDVIITFGPLDGKVNESMSRVSFEIEPKRQLHADVNNGDCVFYCLYLILSRLVTFPLSPLSPRELATIVRAPIIQYIEDHWTEHSIVADMPWWQVIKLQHHEGIPEWERDEYNGDWGCTAEDSLKGWKNVRDDFYGSEAEMTAFVEMMWQYDIPLAIRVWRKNGINELACSSRIHYPLMNADACYVGDILHTGKLDSGQAHCQLMRSGSFQRTIFVAEEEEEEEKSSKRKKKDDDPDYEPSKKLKKKAEPPTRNTKKETKGDSDSDCDMPVSGRRKMRQRLADEQDKKARSGRRLHENAYGFKM